MLTVSRPLDSRAHLKKCNVIAMFGVYPPFRYTLTHDHTFWLLTYSCLASQLKRYDASIKKSMLG